MTTPHAGRCGTAEMTVSDADTAIALGSGDVPVLATPRLIALVEAAAVAAVRELLPPQATTVGTAVELQHLAASRVGARVAAEAVVEAATERELRFRVRAWDVGKVVDVARGWHSRAIVDRERFLRRSRDEA